jgi:hypothetical protein
MPLEQQDERKYAVCTFHVNWCMEKSDSVQLLRPKIPELAKLILAVL